MNILYYITGHGYGHAVRAIEIIKVLLDYPAISHIYVKSTVPHWLFEPICCDRLTYLERNLDIGCIQKNSFYVNKKQTFEKYAQLLQHKSELIQDETRFFHTHQIDLILSDITPFAFDAAHQANLTSFAIGNFSWDWIYAQWLSEFPQYSDIVDDIRASYSKAGQLLRLPFFGDMSVFPSIIDVPLVGRKSIRSSQFIRNQIIPNLQQDRKLVFLGLRKTDMENVDWTGIDTQNRYLFVSQNRKLKGNNIIDLNGSLEFYDILSACDAVLTKPGYSMVSEVILNKVPILYVPRSDNIEDQPLIQGLQKFSVSEPLPPSEFIRGHWCPYLDTLLSKPQNWPPITNNGASYIAQIIMEGV